jgi:hypothetical protein
MHEFVEESFNIEDTFEYILSIQVSLNGFSFSVYQPSLTKVLVFKSTPLKISTENLLARRFKEWIQTEELLQKTYQKIHVIIFTDKFTLVPKSLHKNEVNEEVAHLLFKDGNKLKFAENIVEPAKAKLIFPLPDGFNEVISEMIGECEINHPLKLLINRLPESTTGHSLILLFNMRHLFIVIGKGEKLLFANSFKINHSNDVVYFVLTTLKQLEIPAKATQMYYTGKSDYLAETKANLEKFFASTSQFNPAEPESHKQISNEVITENISLFL